MSDENRTCIACLDEFEPETKRQKRCRTCINTDRRATKASREAADLGLSAGVSDTPLTEELVREQAAKLGLVVERPKTEFKPTVAEDKTDVKVGVVSDTHIGSKAQQLTALADAYAWFRREKVDAVLHVGDLFDGSPNMHPGMAKEQFLHTPTAALEYAVEAYPDAPKRGVRTYIIAGNHDESWEKHGSSNLVEEFANRRRDVEYLGQDEGDAFFADYGWHVRLFHPSGGGNTHLTQVKRAIDREPEESELPDVLLVGHLHRFSILPLHRGVVGIELPALQGQTSFFVKRSLVPNIGALVLTLGDVVTPSWRLFDEKERDW